MDTLRAFHNDPQVKEFYLNRVRAHRAADQLIHGTYWEHGKGCAVGCTIHSGDHSAYEGELGIPRIIARLEDRLFEGMPNADSMLFPERFLQSIPVGADLSGVWDRFAHWLLVDPEHGVIRFADERGKAAIEREAHLYQRKIEGFVILQTEWREAHSAAAAAAAAADAYAAADAAYAADAAAYAADAAYAAYAAYAADAAAAAAAAYAAAAAAAAYAAAKQKHYGVMADKLIELLANAPIPELV